MQVHAGDVHKCLALVANGDAAAVVADLVAAALDRLHDVEVLAAPDAAQDNVALLEVRGGIVVGLEARALLL